EAAACVGWSVVGGFLSPGHDEYVTLKLGNEAIPAAQRVLQCAKATASSAWLTVDPWEALHRQVAVNFTDVLVRLERYLCHHLEKAVEVVYVCGSDNARFALAFQSLGRVIVVERPGYPAHTYRERPEINGSSRIIWAPGSSTESSTKVREGAVQNLHLKPPSPAQRLRLRDDGERAVPDWPATGERWSKFVEGLASCFGSYMDVDLFARQSAPTEGTTENTVSLDPLASSRHTLAVSRLFEPGAYVERGYVERPGAPPLSEQIAAIPEGSYAIWDDDEFSGGTMRFVEAMLAEIGTVTNRRTEIPTEDGEIADARDFLLGTRFGGAVMRLPDGRLCRAPYLLPYVDPFARAGLPPTASLEFSLNVWALNWEFFDGLDLTVAALDRPTQALLLLNWSRSDRVSAIADWHRQHLQRIVRGGS
ncbi:MAG: hypothetical protein KC561_14120, partial [Myxococcales bacterium]|nr:hypothetical protein [Myxococcales bacterium]